MKKNREGKLLLFAILISIAAIETYVFFSTQNSYTHTVTTIPNSATISNISDSSTTTSLSGNSIERVLDKLLGTTITSTVSTTSTTSATTTTAPTTFTVISPQNMFYNIERITVSVRANEISNWIGQSVDGKPVVEECYDCLSFERYDMIFPIGKHTLTAYVEGKNGKTETAVINFEVLPPGASTTTSISSSTISSTTTSALSSSTSSITSTSTTFSTSSSTTTTNTTSSSSTTTSRVTTTTRPGRYQD